METIAIDIDDVLSAHARAFADWSNNNYGTNITPNDYQEKWEDVWKIEYEETIRRAHEYHESDHLSLCNVIEGGQEALIKLKAKFRLIALTSRRNSINKLTRDWLDRHYPNIFDDIIFAGFFDTITNDSLKLTKGELAKKIGADYIIDDQLKHIFSAAQLGIHGILFGDYTWNQTDVLPKNTIRANNWSEVLHFFKIL